MESLSPEDYARTRPRPEEETTFAAEIAENAERNNKKQNSLKV
jgi:hypothetical protein